MYLIEIKTHFEGFHRWRKAPKEVEFLRDWHRHLFEVTVRLDVTHRERDLEFFLMKKKIDKYLATYYAGKRFESSCEHIAEDLAKKFKAISVTVREDNENAGIFINS